MEGLAARITPLKLNIKRLSLQSSVLNAWVVSGSQPYLTGHFSSWETPITAVSFLPLFFLILLPLHPPSLKRASYHSVTTLFHLPSFSSVWVKTPPIFRVNCFQLFCLITSTCTYLFTWKYSTSESISCSHFLWFHPGKGFVFPSIVDAVPLISDVNVFLRFCLVHD